jgi:hypothetical protein
VKAPSGQQIGGYRIDEMIGSGVVGVVYRASAEP